VADEIGVAGGGDGLGDALPAGRRGRAGRVPTAAPPVALAAPDPVAAEVLDRLARVDVDRITPVEALMALAELKRLGSA
jgi:DNA mismatch repair protein MutS